MNNPLPSKQDIENQTRERKIIRYQKIRESKDHILEIIKQQRIKSNNTHLWDCINASDIPNKDMLEYLYWWKAGYKYFKYTGAKHVNKLLKEENGIVFEKGNSSWFYSGNGCNKDQYKWSFDM